MVLILDELRRVEHTWAERFFGGSLPVVEMVVAGGFAVASISQSNFIAAAVFAVFVGLFLFAVAERRVVDIALLAGTYFVFRFHLIESAPMFRYLSDLIFLATAVAVVALLVTRRGRLRWYDGIFVAFGIYALGLAVFRDVPLMPAVVQLRALLTVYPLFILVREIGFESAGPRNVAALIYYEFFAWAVFAQAAIEKATGKILFMTSFVRWTSISRTNWPRVYGWTANPNSLGALCVLLIALGILLAAWGVRGRWLQRSFALYFATLVLSVSRSAAWGLLVFLGVLLVQRTFETLSRRELIKTLIKPFAVGLLCAVIVILLSIAIPRVTRALHPAEEGFSVFGRFITGDEEVESSMKGGRLFSLRTGLEIATGSAGDLLLGQGPATFGSAGSNFWESPLYEPYEIPETFYADLFYMMMLVEVGAIGLALYLGGIVGLAWSNSVMPLAWRMGIGLVFALWCLFYNVPELTMLYFPILVFLGVPLTRPSPEDIQAIPEGLWLKGMALDSADGTAAA